MPLHTFNLFLKKLSNYIFPTLNKKPFSLSTCRKLESEGFPKDVVTPEQKAAYCDELNEAMPGLNLKPENVKRNWPRRMFAKEVSNMSLGKLSQNEQRTNVAFAYCWEDISRLKYSPNKTVKSVYPFSKDVAQVQYVPVEERAGYARNVNPVVYAMVTSEARLKLLRSMCRLHEKGARVHYCDTGKCCFPLKQYFAQKRLFLFPYIIDLYFIIIYYCRLRHLRLPQGRRPRGPAEGVQAQQPSLRRVEI